MSIQLIKENKLQGYDKIYPNTFIDAIKDRDTGISLRDILNRFNMYYLSYVGSREQTRLQVPSILRRKGLCITYVKYNGTIIVEWYISDIVNDESFRKDSNWKKGNIISVDNAVISSSDNLSIK